MADLFDDPIVRAAVGLLVLCVLVTVAFHLVSSFRDYAAEDREDAHELLAKLQEMNLKGDITDEEFRTIQAASHPHHDDAADETDARSLDNQSGDLPSANN